MLIVNVRTDSDAFASMADEIGEHEAARILRSIADKIERGEATGKFQTVHDTNGNDVGRWKLTRD